MLSFLTIFFWDSFRLLKWFHLWVNYLFTVLHSSSWTVLHCLSCNTWTRSTCDQIAEKSKSGWMHVSHRVWSLSTTRLSAQFGIHLQIAEKWKWGCINMWVTEYDHSQMQGGPVQFGIPLQRCNVNYLSMIFIHCKTFLHSLAFLLIDCFAHRGLCCSVPVQIWGLFLIISSGDDLTYR